LSVPGSVADGGESKPAEGGADTPDRMGMRRRHRFLLAGGGLGRRRAWGWRAWEAAGLGAAGLGGGELG